jgi:hypothetical protein
MPSNLVITQPDAVMPQGLMSAFREQIERPALVDDGYALGESTRFAMTTLSRRTFRLARRLNQADTTALYNFLAARKARPFWFYNLRETQPVGSWDPTGANPVGRYAVVWQGPLTQSTDLGLRGTSEFELREVSL